VMNSDGTGVKELTEAQAASFEPDWSPDGKKIAFTSNSSGTLRSGQ
jgi:TolB protein